MSEDIEQKYIFLEQEKELIFEWLSHSLVCDPKFFCGSVFSLYYDTPNLDLYYEKRHSDYLKSKVRLRWYSDCGGYPPDHQVKCYLEVKEKVGVLRRKTRKEFYLASSVLTGDLFVQNEIANIPLRIDELAYVPRGILVPIVLIQYTRYRFIDPQTGSRIALDSNIWCTNANSSYIAGFPPVQLDVGVLEIKGARRHLISSLKTISSHLIREAFSKYARCCEHLMLPLSRRM